MGKKSTEALAMEFQITNNKESNCSSLIRTNSPPYGERKSEITEPISSVFAIADVDWIYNGFSLADARMGDRVFSRPINDNHKLFLEYD